MVNNFSDKANFIWSIANLLRDAFKRSKYQDVILPLTVLRRIDCVLGQPKTGFWKPIISSRANWTTWPPSSARLPASPFTTPRPSPLNVPLGKDIDAYFDREVRPHVPDAWINTAIRDHKDGEIGKVGYEINFNRYFYKYQPPRPLEEIEADIRQLEAEIAEMLRHLSGDSAAT